MTPQSPVPTLCSASKLEMLLLHLHHCISLHKHPFFSPPSLFFNTHKASVSAFGLETWEALNKSRGRRRQGVSFPPLRAAEKDSDYEVDPDKAREALRKLDEQLQSLAQKKADPPKIRGKPSACLSFTQSVSEYCHISNLMARSFRYEWWS